MKGKKMLLLSTLLGLFLSGLGFVGCTNVSVSSEDSSESSSVEEISGTISLPSTSTVSEFETVALTPTIEGKAGTVEWSSADSGIATVDGNGIVYGVKAGSVKITAKMGESVAECNVTVTPTRYAHEIVLSLDSLIIGTGDSQQIDVSVRFMGKTLDQAEYGIVYDWTPISDAESFVTVETENNGARAVFTAVSSGEAKYEVKSIVRGYEISEQVTITVRDSVSFEFENEAIVAGEGAYEVSLILGDESTERVAIGDINVTFNQNPPEAVTFSWVSDSRDIADVENGVIIATGLGTAVLTGTTTYNGKEYNLMINATVAKGERALDISPLLETGTATTFILPEGVKETNVEKITINDGTVLYDIEDPTAKPVSGREVTLFTRNFPVTEDKMGEGRPMTIETDKVVYSLTIDLFTLKIDSMEKFESWQEVAANAAVRSGRIGEEKRGAILSGYFILAMDIELNEPYIPYITCDGLYGLVQGDWKHGAYGFEGTFDGRGHIIEGLNCTGPSNKSYAFVTALTKSGVIRNISFTKATVSGDASLIVAAGTGTCENIYVEYVRFGNGINTPQGERGASTFFSTKINSADQTLKNILIDISFCEFDAVPKNMSIIGPACANIDGAYIIGNTFTENKDNNAFLTYDYTGSFEEGDIKGQFVSTAALLANKAHGDIVRAWNEEFWSVGDKLVLPVAVYDKAMQDLTSSVHRFTNTETSINLGQSLILTADEKYVEFSLKQAQDGVMIDGNVLSVKSPAEVGDSITVIATSLLDNTTAELTLTVVKQKDTIIAEGTIDVDMGLSVTSGVLSASSKAQLDCSEVSDVITGKGITVRLGETVIYEGAGSSVLTLDLSNISGGVFGKQEIDIYITEAEKDTEIKMTVMMISKVITTKDEFNGWQELASYVALATGNYEGSQLGCFMDGYFTLGADIVYNAVWSPYKDYNALWGLAEGHSWTNSTYCGFYGTFDGRGHKVEGLQISGLNNAFIVTMGSNATLKNISFTKASVEGQNSFLVYASGGKYENIFVEYAKISNTSGKDLCTFALSGNSNDAVFNHVVIDVTNCVFDESVQNVYLVGWWHKRGVYVVGKVYGEVPAFKAGELANCQFADYAELLVDGWANVSTWDKAFWDIETGKPVNL